MATVSRGARRRRRRYDDEIYDDLPPVRRERKSARSTKLLLAAGALAGLAWFAPTIVAKSPLAGQFIDRATADLDGSVQVGSLSLGWFSPVVLHDVEIRDDRGGLVARLRKVEGQRQLLSLLRDSENLGRFRVEGPLLRVVIDEQGSNVERLLSTYLADDDSSLETTAVDLEIVDGELTLIDMTRDATWQWRDVEIAAHVPQRLTDPVNIEAQARLDDQAAGGEARLTAEMYYNEIDHAEPASTGHVTLATKGLPLDAVAWCVERFAPGTELSGRMAADLKYDWTPTVSGKAATADVVGTLSAQGLKVSGPWLGDDRLELARVELPCDIHQRGNQWDVRQLSLECDLGHVSYRGGYDAAAGVMASLAEQTYEASGSLDLARLATLLPHTLHVREGMQLTEGEVAFQLTSLEQNGKGVWQGRLETTRLAARSRGAGIAQGPTPTWDEPLLVTFRAHEVGDEVLVDELRCESSFLELEASGEPNYFAMAASYDLQKLADELRDFVDLRDVVLSGDGWSYVSWERDAAGQFSAEGETQIRELEITLPGARPVREENLIAFAKAKGHAATMYRADRIDSGSLRIDSGLDRVRAQLTAPIENLSSESSWPVTAEAMGQLANWMPRLAPVIGTLEDYTVAGNAKISVTGTLEPSGLELQSAEAAVGNLHVAGGGVYVDEPEAVLRLAGRYDAEHNAARLSRLELVTPTLTAQANDLAARWEQAGSPQVTGQLQYAGDLRLLQQWFRNPATPPSWNFGGSVQGQLAMTGGDASAIEWMSTIDNLVAQQAGGELWHQRQVRSLGRARYEENADRIVLSRLELQSEALAAAGSGHIDNWGGKQHLELSGQIDYDMPELARLLQPYLGEGVQVVGRQRRTFSVRGDLTSPEDAVAGTLEASLVGRMAGQTSLGWDRARAYGFDIGGGELSGSLADGRLTVASLDVPLSGGRLRADPLVVLAPGAAELFVQPGTLLDRVRVTPEICNAALMYVVPVLAGVAQAEGSLSLETSGCRVPLSTPDQGEVGGRLIVHDVQIGAGPLVRELAVLLQRPTTAQLQRESAVAFRMVGGRIYHRDLELVFPDLTIRTYGSVGLDGTLALMAEMPVPPKWIGNNRLGTALRNQIIQLPIGGTLSEPKIDQTALRQTSARFIQGAATDVIRGEVENQINNQLDRLLRRPQ